MRALGSARIPGYFCKLLILESRYQISVSGRGMYLWSAGYSRGHLVPVQGDEKDDSVNLFPINISPQDESFNNNDWYITRLLRFSVFVWLCWFFDVTACRALANY